MLFQDRCPLLGSKEARRLYEELRANGWEETLRRRKPDAGEKKVNLTISEYLEAVEAKSAIYFKTVEGYAAALRKIAADIHGLAETGEKKSPIHGRHGEQKSVP